MRNLSLAILVTILIVIVFSFKLIKDESSAIPESLQGCYGGGSVEKIRLDGKYIAIFKPRDIFASITFSNDNSGKYILPSIGIELKNRDGYYRFEKSEITSKIRVVERGSIYLQFLSDKDLILIPMTTCN